MSDQFDPYHKWLGIPPEEQPADNYRLLGVKRFEDDADVISNAADQRMAHLRSFQVGRHGHLSQELLNQVSAAKLCLLRPQRKSEYDAALRKATEVEASPERTAAIVPPPPAASAFDPPPPVEPPVPAPRAPGEDTGAKLNTLFENVSATQQSLIARAREKLRKKTGVIPDERSNEEKVAARMSRLNIFVTVLFAVDCLLGVGLVGVIMDGPMSTATSHGKQTTTQPPGEQCPPPSPSVTSLTLRWREAEREGAELRIDGLRLAPTASSAEHLEFELKPGEHEVRIVREGYVAFNEKLTLLLGKKTDKIVVLVSKKEKRSEAAEGVPSVLPWSDETKEILRFKGHKVFVNSLAFSPDGKRIVSAPYIGSRHDRKDGKSIRVPTAIRVWDTKTGQQVATLQGHRGNIHQVVFSPDGRTILSAANEDARLWDARTGKHTGTLDAHKDWVVSAVFSPDGKRVLTAGRYDRSIILWDVATRKEIRRLEGHSDAVWSVAFSPDGRRAVSGGRDTTVRLWDVTSGKEIRRFVDHSEMVWKVAFSFDGKSILSGGGAPSFQDHKPVGKDFAIRLWDVDTGKLVRRCEGHLYCVRELWFSPDASTAISASSRDGAILWNLRTGEKLRDFPFDQAVAVSLDGKFAIFSNERSTECSLWQLSDSCLAAKAASRSTGKQSKDIKTLTGEPEKGKAG